MQERRLRFDFVLALLAVVLSGVAAGASVYQAMEISDQFSATVWPVLDMNATFDDGQIILEVRNEGLGPALVRSAQLEWDGRPMARWRDILPQLIGKPTARGKGTKGSGTLSSFGAGSIIRPGDSHVIVNIRGPISGTRAAANERRAKLVVCYCSILKRCWITTMLADSDADPLDVKSCSIRSRLEL